MTTTIVARQFQREDQDAVIQLYKNGLTWYSSENSIPEVPPLTKRFAEARCEEGGDMYDIEAYFLRGDRRNNFFVAYDSENNNKIVGCVGAIPSTEFDPDQYLELVRMSVDTSYRGSGVGSVLMNAFESWAHQIGYQRLNLTTLDGMQPAVKFYTKNGFEIVREKEQRLDLTKYGFEANEKANSVNVVHFVKNLN